MPTNEPTDRNEAIDLLRGLVMVIMVLDHARDFWGGFTPTPTDLDSTTMPLFFTRWITHLCAPVFVFLAGTSAYLYGSRRHARQLSYFLLTRGLWLVLIELTVCKYVWIPEPGYSTALLQVIWVIGWSMVALAGLCFFKRNSCRFIQAKNELFRCSDFERSLRDNLTFYAQSLNVGPLRCRRHGRPAGGRGREGRPTGQGETAGVEAAGLHGVHTSPVVRHTPSGLLPASAVLR